MYLLKRKATSTWNGLASGPAQRHRSPHVPDPPGHLALGAECAARPLKCRHQAVGATGLYVVLGAAESESVWRVLVGVVAAVAAFVAWISPVVVALLLWWVWTRAGVPRVQDI